MVQFCLSANEVDTCFGPGLLHTHFIGFSRVEKEAFPAKAFKDWLLCPASECVRRGCHRGAEDDARSAVVPPADGANTFVRAVQILAQHPHDLQADLPVLAKEFQQFSSAHEYDLGVV